MVGDTPSQPRVGDGAAQLRQQDDGGVGELRDSRSPETRETILPAPSHPAPVPPGAPRSEFKQPKQPFARWLSLVGLIGNRGGPSRGAVTSSVRTHDSSGLRILAKSPHALMATSRTGAAASNALSNAQTHRRSTNEPLLLVIDSHLEEPIWVARSYVEVPGPIESKIARETADRLPRW